MFVVLFMGCRSGRGGIPGICGPFGLIGKFRPKLGLILVETVLSLGKDTTVTQNLLKQILQTYVLGDFTTHNSPFSHGNLAHGSTVKKYFLLSITVSLLVLI